MTDRAPDAPKRVALKRHVRSMQRHEGGGSQPQVFGAEDGSQWMVKARNNPQGVQTLANELVGTSVAALLGGAVQPNAICDLPPELASAVRFGDGQEWEAGTAFGSELLDVAVPYVPGMLSEVVNPQALLAVVVTDTWLTCNDSRQALATSHPNGGYEVMAVDFGHSIGSPAWTAAELQGRPMPGTFVDMHGWTASRREGMATEMAEIVEAVADHELAAIASYVPGEWGVTPTDAEALISYLIGRRAALVALLRDLERQERVA